MTEQAQPFTDTTQADDTARLRILAPQAKLLSAVLLVVGIVLSAPHSIFSAVCVIALVLLLAFIAQARVKRILTQSLIVVPIAGMISLFYPLRFVAEWSVSGFVNAYATNWQPMLQLIITPWLCVLVMMLLVHTTTRTDLLYALERLRLPRILVMMLSFMYRYVDVMRTQLRAAHRSLVSRAPGLSKRRQVLLYGNLAGSMLIRAYDRGERIHAAMLSRGFNGTLPLATAPRLQSADMLLIAGTVLFAVALVLIGL